MFKKAIMSTALYLKNNKRFFLEGQVTFFFRGTSYFW